MMSLAWVFADRSCVLFFHLLISFFSQDLVQLRLKVDCQPDDQVPGERWRALVAVV
jgi:hypothetical protein